MPRIFDVSLRERRARIACWIAQRTDADIVTGLCEAWVHDLVDGGYEPQSRHELPGLPSELSLVNRLSDAGYHEHANALAWLIDDGEGIEPAEAPLIAHALAMASGRAYVAHGAGELHWIGHLVSTIDRQAWEAFADSSAATLSEDADRRSAFVEFLTAIIQKASDAPDSVAEIPPRCASMASIVEQFVKTGSFQEVCQADLAPVFFRWSDAFEILRRAEPERFLEMIDELPHPMLVKQCLNSRALIENPGEILRLLRQAPHASFDTDGRWQRQGMAVILLLQLASVQLLSAPNTPDRNTLLAEPLVRLAEPQAAEEVEDLAKGITQFRKSADGLLDILFARPDGIQLGWHWLEHLLRQLPQRRPPAPSLTARKLMINHIGILVHALSSRLAPRRTQDVWIVDAEPLVRQYRAVAVLSAAAFSGTESDLDIGAVARGLLKRNRFELTRAIELIHLPGAPLRTIPGDAFARIPDVASWFTQTWSALRFEREQAWRLPTARCGVDANPAEIMGVWGLGVLESLAMDEGRSGDARAMWLALEAAFRESRLVEPRVAKDFWCEAIARLFAWWPVLFTSTPEPAMNGVESTPAEATGLGGVLAPYIGINKDFMGIVVSLHQAGIGVMTVDCTVREVGQDLLRMIHRFLETARALKDARLWNQEWVAALGSIKAAIAAQRLANEETYGPLARMT
jgi:hypothetical protein